ncbi:MAG TPA: hypothetical protein VJW76_14515 [Verrucomicrobiae bacterium]|nr:hypothetical protein [Verrucomicrobiae bacterium]
MNPCSRYKKQIALLATKSLSANEARQVREHLHQCGRCQEYWNDVSRLCGDHFDLAASLPTMEVDERFHQRLVGRITANERARKGPPSVVTTFLGAITLFRWKVVFASSTVVAMVGLLTFLVSRPKVESPVVHSDLPPVSPAVAKEATPPPTLMAYRLVASRSFEELDARLAVDADRLLPATPLMTASMPRELDREE